MPAPAIGVTPRWAYGPNGHLDPSHPQAPTCGWIPAMGMRTLHDDPVTPFADANAVSWSNPTNVGPSHFPTSIDHIMRFPNRVGGTARVILSLVVLQRHVASPTANKAPLFYRNNAANNIMGIQYGTSWAAKYGNQSLTNSGVAYSSGDQLVGVVFATSTMEWWINGARVATASLALNAIDATAMPHWETGDSQESPTGNRAWTSPISLYAVYDRALTGNDFAALWADPFCYMRR